MFFKEFLTERKRKEKTLLRTHMYLYSLFYSLANEAHTHIQTKPLQFMLKFEKQRKKKEKNYSKKQNPKS